MRLMRSGHLGCGFLPPSSLASVGCLSLPDYGMPPSLSEVARLSRDVKRLLQLFPGAPELVLNLGTSGTLNVEWKWAPSHLRLWLWLKISSTPDGRELWMRLFCLQLQASCLQWSFFTYN